MTKKLSRSRRKELRLHDRPRAVAEKAAESSQGTESQGRRPDTEKQAEERAASARLHEARAAIAQREEERALGSGKVPPARRDRTMLIVLGVIGAAGVIYWLLQRPPTRSEAVAKPPSSASSSSPPWVPARGVVSTAEAIAPPVMSAAPSPVVSAVPTPAAAPGAAGVVGPKDAPAKPAKPKPAPVKVVPNKAAGADPYG